MGEPEFSTHQSLSDCGSASCMYASHTPGTIRMAPLFDFVHSAHSVAAITMEFAPTRLVGV